MRWSTSTTTGNTGNTATEEVTGLGSRDVRLGSRSVSGWRALSGSGLPDLPARGHHPDSYGIGSGEAVWVEADSGDSISVLLYVLGDLGSERSVFDYVGYPFSRTTSPLWALELRFRSTREFLLMFRSFCRPGWE